MPPWHRPLSPLFSCWKCVNVVRYHNLKTLMQGAGIVYCWTYLLMHAQDTCFWHQCCQCIMAWNRITLRHMLSEWLLLWYSHKKTYKLHTQVTNYQCLIVVWLSCWLIYTVYQHTRFDIFIWKKYIVIHSNFYACYSPLFVLSDTPVSYYVSVLGDLVICHNVSIKNDICSAIILHLAAQFHQLYAACSWNAMTFLSLSKICLVQKVLGSGHSYKILHMPQQHCCCGMCKIL